MNSDIVPIGPTELVGVGSITNRQVLVGTAIGAVTFTGLAYIHPATPANAAVVTAGTLPAGASLRNFKNITISSGVLEVIYKY